MATKYKIYNKTKKYFSDFNLEYFLKGAVIGVVSVKVFGFLLNALLLK